MSVAENGGIPVSNLGQFGDEALKTPEMVRASEALAWSKTLGAPVEVSSLPEFITAPTIEHLENLDFNLRFVPSLDVPFYILFGGTPDNPQPTGYVPNLPFDTDWHDKFQEFANEVAQRYPRIPKKLIKVAGIPKEPTGDFGPFGVYDDESNHFATFWRSIAPGKAHWVALERTNRPTFISDTSNKTQPYDPSIVSNLLHINPARKEKYKDIQSRFTTEGQRILTTVFGVNDDKVKMRLLTPPEWMTLAMREEWYKARPAAREWLQEEGTVARGFVGPEIVVDVAMSIGNESNIAQIRWLKDESMRLGTGNLDLDKMGYRIAIDLSENPETNFKKFAW